LFQSFASGIEGSLVDSGRVSKRGAIVEGRVVGIVDEVNDRSRVEIVGTERRENIGINEFSNSEVEVA
jgi:hypothetical protein